MFQSKSFKDNQKRKKEKQDSPVKKNQYSAIKGRDKKKKKSKYDKFHICRTATMILVAILTFLVMIMGVSIIHENASRLKETEKVSFIEDENKWNSTYYQQLKNVRVGIIIDESKYQTLLQQLNIEQTKLRNTKVISEIKEI